RSEPIRVTQIDCAEAGAVSLLPNQKDRAATKVSITDGTTPVSLALSGTDSPWKPTDPKSTHFCVPAGSTNTPANLPITFGLDIPKTATYNYLGPTAANFATVTFTFDFLVPKSLNDYSWADLAVIADDLSAHATDDPATTGEGSIYYTEFKDFMKKDSRKELGGSLPSVRIIGINHDDKVGGGKAGLTFMTDDIVPASALPADCRTYMNPTDTNSDGWEGSYMRTTNMKPAKPTETGGPVWEAFKTAKPADNPTPYIKEVDKKNKKGTSPTHDKLFLLSNCEIRGNGWIPGEGEQYPFFASVPIKDGDNEILKFGPAPNYTRWWERSSFRGSNSIFVSCGANGNPSYNDSTASISYGVVPGFSL
ncbi:MAG: DUF6273 domain-containing protein, partial [Angelakisella sp.]